jgi:hypothetical protein
MMSPKPKDHVPGEQEVPQDAKHDSDLAAGAGETFTFQRFVDVHRNQLETSVVPDRFWGALFNKIMNNVRGLFSGDYTKIKHSSDPNTL